MNNFLRLLDFDDDGGTMQVTWVLLLVICP